MKTTNTTTVKNKTLVQFQKDAIAKGNAYKRHERSSVVSAFDCGHALIKVKAELSHGAFEDWIKDNMPIGKTQCGTFRKLAEARDSEWIKVHLNDVLSINCELALIKVKDDKADEIRKWAADNKANQAEILKHINEILNEDKQPVVITQEVYIKKAQKLINEISNLSIVEDDNPRSEVFDKLVQDVLKLVDAFNNVLTVESEPKTELEAA